MDENQSMQTTQEDNRALKERGTPDIRVMMAMPADDIMVAINGYLRNYFKMAELEEVVEGAIDSINQSENELLEQLQNGFDTYSDSICNGNYNKYMQKGSSTNIVTILKKIRFRIVFPILFLVFLVVLYIESRSPYSAMGVFDILLNAFTGGLMIALLICIPLSLIVKIFGGPYGKLMEFSEKMQLKAARNKDKKFCRQNDITIDSLKSAYKYNEQYVEITSHTEQARNEVYNGTNDELAFLREEVAYWQGWFPSDYRDPDYLWFIFKEFDNGGADTWKEALAKLQHEMHHQESMAALGQMKQELSTFRAQNIQSMNALYDSIGALHGEFDRRMEGMATAMNNYHNSQMDMIVMTGRW
ncbi:hypothetical protein LJC49_07005 [Ruminococcaceae bacterium OttesenSCG-928-I18]|nr:hypothetical protein [Ruminococcaceae bacterium OttesenSCG-928-I18]